MNTRLKEIMFYDKNKTLLENKMAIEEDLIKGALRRVANANSLKRVEPALHSALESVILNGNTTRNPIKGIKTIGGSAHEPIQSVDELIIAVRQGLKAEEKARLYVGLLKANNTPMGILDDVAREAVSSTRFADTYKVFQTEGELRTALKNNGYSDEGIEAIIRESKTNTNFINAQKAAAAGTPTPTPKPVPFDWKQKLRNALKTMKWFAIVKYGATIGIPAAVIYYFYKEINATVEGGMEEPKNHGFLPCIEEKIKNKIASIKVNDNGTISAIIKTKENPQGLMFNNDGTVNDLSNGKTGTYKCK